MFKKKNKKIQNNEPRRQVSDSKTNRAFSYYSGSRSTQEQTNRPRNDSFDQEIKIKNRNLKFIPTILASILILISVIYVSMINTSAIKIVPLVDNSANILQESEVYQNSISQMLNSSLFNRSKLTINTKSLEQKIKETHPEIKEVSVNVPIIGQNLIVQLSPNTPKLEIETMKGSYVVDANGRVLMELNKVPEAKRGELIKVRDLVLQDAKPGDYALSEETIKFIDDVLFQFDKRQIEIDYISLPAVANELHIKPKDKNYIVKFNIQGNAREQSGVYFAIADKIANEKSEQPAEYVDVRVESRAFIK